MAGDSSDHGAPPGSPIRTRKFKSPRSFYQTNDVDASAMDLDGDVAATGQHALTEHQSTRSGIIGDNTAAEDVDEDLPEGEDLIVSPGGSDDEAVNQEEVERLEAEHDQRLRIEAEQEELQEARRMQQRLWSQAYDPVRPDEARAFSGDVTTATDLAIGSTMSFPPLKLPGHSRNPVSINQADAGGSTIQLPAATSGYKLDQNLEGNTNERPHHLSSRLTPNVEESSATSPPNVLIDTQVDSTDSSIEVKNTSITEPASLLDIIDMAESTHDNGAKQVVTSTAIEPDKKKVKLSVKKSSQDPGSKSKYRADNEEMLYDEKSPLATSNDIVRSILLDPRVWDLITPQQKAEVLALWPDQSEILHAGTERATLDFELLKNNNHLRADAAQYQEDLRAGRHNGQWIAEAMGAHHEREDGDAITAYHVATFSENWGVDRPAARPPPVLPALDSSASAAGITANSSGKIDHGAELRERNGEDDKVMGGTLEDEGGKGEEAANKAKDEIMMHED
ncbi:hypothetical protein BX600DRAFT_516476 [Xylariales sp. PMI_506]|nr:hypothetical protein BX600DRAFT_516476 [Xylariales sp. PMI_506]